MGVNEYGFEEESDVKEHIRHRAGKASVVKRHKRKRVFDALKFLGSQKI